MITNNQQTLVYSIFLLSSNKLHFPEAISSSSQYRRRRDNSRTESVFFTTNVGKEDFKRNCWRIVVTKRRNVRYSTLRFRLRAASVARWTGSILSQRCYHEHSASTIVFTLQHGCCSNHLPSISETLCLVENEERQIMYWSWGEQEGAGLQLYTVKLKLLTSSWRWKQRYRVIPTVFMLGDKPQRSTEHHSVSDKHFKMISSRKETLLSAASTSSVH